MLHYARYSFISLTLGALLSLPTVVPVWAQTTPSGFPAATVPLDGNDRAVLDQGTGCATNVAPCTTKEVPSTRMGQPVQGTVAPASPFQYQWWIDTSLSPPVLKQFIGSTWYPEWTLDAANGALIKVNQPISIANGGTNTASQTTNGACYYNGTILTCPGQLPILEGGTNATSQTTNGACYFDGTKITCPGAMPILEGGTNTTTMTNNGGCYFDNVKVNCTGSLPIASGGTAASSQTTNGACYFDGSKITCPGALPVAQGGTGDTGTAWTAYNPSFTCGSGGPISSYIWVAAYKTIGKTVFLTVSLSITTNGTCATSITVSLPITASGTRLHTISGRNQTSGISGACSISVSGTGMICGRYDGTYPGADGQSIVWSGVYESN